MRLISMGIYFWLVFLWIPIVKNQYNLYNTDRNRNSLLYHDCLRYEVDDPEMFKSSMRYYHPPFQIISYCLRPVGDEVDSNEIVKGNYSSFRFDELNDMNVTAQDLIRWSISFDLVEDYQEYLVTAKSTLGQQFLNNCSDTWFGLYCQYKADPNLEFKRLVKFIFLQKQTRSYNELFPLELTRLICYTQLKCDRCLDWREICDGKIDCPIDGADEQNCLDLEMNECANNEYRCHNGLCVPETFLHDDSLNPDCLDSTDEYEYKFLSLHSKAYINCYRDPAFRCEESRHPFQLQNFPCGDGQTSRIFQQSCTNKRDTMHFETLLSFEKNMILSSDCWFALYCATSINHLANDECKIFCKILRCTYNLQDKCDSDSVFVFFPQHVILHDHIRFAYLTNKTIQRRQLEAVPLPDYVCYDARRCPFLTSNLHVNGSACKLTTELKVNATFEIDQFFRACPIEYQKDNRTEFQLRSLFQCPNTTKFISKHRLQDGISDCYQNTDENNVDACSLNHKHRFKCRSENKCISPTVVFDYKPHCIGAEDETRFTKVLPSFQDFCDGFKSSSFEPELVDNQNETDETNCEKWPCDNMYTHCDKAWSCLNGTDEAFCEFRSCSKGSLPCVLPYNFTITCLPISRANDGIIDCLGSSDERSYCRSFGYQVLPYRCWNDTTCIPADNLCQKQQCPFDNIESQCQNKDILNSFDSLNRDVDHVAKLRKRYFSLAGTAAFPHATNITRHSASMKPIMKRALVSHDISTENDVFSKLDPWKCNRGIPIEMGTENNYHCFCPPSYYGDHCQFQSQRVSLTLEMQKICAPDCTGFYGLLVTLFDNEQVIHSQEQVTYISTMDCHRKFNLYLLYSERSKDLNKNYTIRVDAYNKIDMSYYSSWVLPVQFAFLPVNRISSLLTVPAIAVTSKCSKYCAHGQCSLYVNTKQQFCLCESGWSGEHCTMPLNCSCSSDSLCLSTVHNRSTCLCPLNKYGPRCLLSSICQSNICQKESKICIHDDMNGNIFKCLCRHKFFGDQCENTARMEVSFSDLAISQVLLAHFITVTGDTEPERITVLTKIKFDQDEAIFYTLTLSYHLSFVQIQRDYYLAIVSQTAVAVSETKITLDPSRRCPHIRELVDKRTASYPLVRRVKYYHMICGQRLDLFCFHDEEAFMCLCTIERHANCFHFDFNMTYDCHGLNDCQNGAECFTNEGCSTWIMCACPECFYGSKCQFTTKGFSLSLDTILGYSIRPYIPFSRQSTVVKVSITITAIMLFIGLINGIVSTMIFQVKSLRENGCGYYLLASSILSLLIVTVFTLKFVFFLLSQMSILTNRTFLEINCTCMDFLFRSLLAINDWLNASVAIERVVIAIQGTKFNKRKSRRTARFVIPIMAIVVFGSIVHDPIYRELVEDTEEQRSWCIVQYHSFQLELLNSAMNIVHFTLPFSINLISALVIIITVSRQRASAQKNISYRQHLREQWRHHSHLIFSPIILVLLAIPRLIISFLSGCMKSHRYPGLFLTGYFISFVPPLLTFVVYVVPSKTYKKQFDTLVTQYRTALRRLLNIQ